MKKPSRLAFPLALILCAGTFCGFAPASAAPAPPARDTDPTARLHGWSHGREPFEAAGVGPYGPAAERCVYLQDCNEIRSYFNEMRLHD